MPAYRYEACDRGGVLRAGQLEAPSRGLALERLARDGLIPIAIQEGHGAVQQRVPWRMPSVRALRSSVQTQLSARELLFLTQSLAALLQAGLTVDRALQIGTSLGTGAAARALAAELLRAVRAGRTLADAFRQAPVRLPPYFVSMVDAGEVGGSLPETLARLAELLRRHLEVRERIRSALIYPTLLAAVVLVTLLVLLAFVLPRFEALFAESEVPLPRSTQAVLAAGRFVADYWWAIGAIAAAALVLFVSTMRSALGRERLDRWLLRTRLTQGLPAAIETARLLRTVSTLCGNGLPLPQALRVARGTLANRCLAAALQAVTSAVQAGEVLSAALARAGVFPPVAVQLARVGEETGRLEELLLSAAAVLEEESHARLERLLTLLVPALTVGMGLVVAALIGSVLIGLLSINELAF